MASLGGSLSFDQQMYVVATLTAVTAVLVPGMMHGGKRHCGSSLSDVRSMPHHHLKHTSPLNPFTHTHRWKNLQQHHSCDRRRQTAPCPSAAGIPTAAAAATRHRPGGGDVTACAVVLQC